MCLVYVLYILGIFLNICLVYFNIFFRIFSKQIIVPGRLPKGKENMTNGAYRAAEKGPKRDRQPTQIGRDVVSATLMRRKSPVDF